MKHTKKKSVSKSRSLDAEDKRIAMHTASARVNMMESEKGFLKDLSKVISVSLSSIDRRISLIDNLISAERASVENVTTAPPQGRRGEIGRNG